MTDTNTTIPPSSEFTMDDLVARMDMFGEQMNWLCDNLAGLFQFVNQMGANGGGIRGLIKATKDMPELIQQPGVEND
jgi:hypothetical protein